MRVLVRQGFVMVGLGASLFWPLSVAVAEPPAGKGFFGVPLPPGDGGGGLPSLPRSTPELPPSSTPPASLPSPGADSPTTPGAKGQPTLGGTKWRTTSGKIVTFFPDGTAAANWHGNKGSWEMTSGSTAKIAVFSQKKATATMVLSADGTKLTKPDGEVWVRIEP